MKKVLLLCASHNDLGLVHSLRKLGFYIICTGNTPGLPAEKFVDQYIQADYSNKELILNIAQEYKVDAICQCCNDFGVYTASYVAEKLNLPGYDSYETTVLMHNKDKFSEFAEKNNISTPKSYAFNNYTEAMEWLEQNAQYPLIIKPVDASAGNGISKIESIEEAREVLHNAFIKSKSGRVVIEPFIKGSQHGFCTFLKDEKVVACCSNNEYSILNPYRVEIDTYPADNYAFVSKQLIIEIEKIASILKLKDGIFHLQYIMDKNRPMIIEVMRRVLGNMYSVSANLLNGFDWDYWETRAKCGMSCEDFPIINYQQGYYAYKTILANKNGTIKEINIPLKYRKYLWKDFFLKQPGENITDYKKEPVGFLFFEFSSDNEMKKILINEYLDNLVTMEE